VASLQHFLTHHSQLHYGVSQFVMPAKAGIQCRCVGADWIPAFAGMTLFLDLAELHR